FKDPISGSEQYADWFQDQGPRDEQGRSLRDLDLEQRLFRYPLSYLIYSPDIDTLPRYALDYVYQRLAAVLEGRDKSEAFAHLSAYDRKTIVAILTTTKPD